MFSSRPRPEPAGHDRESAWDYPRPPRVEPTTRHLVVILGGETIAETTEGLRVLETSHPPNYYFPVEDVAPGALEPATGASFCEWKGRARYYTVHGGTRTAPSAAWAYDEPSPAFAALVGHVAFYAGRVDRCLVDGEPVTPQPGDFYGGWITEDVVGPFKGGPGSRAW